MYSLGEAISDSDHSPWFMESSVSNVASVVGNDEATASYEALACINISSFDEERLWIRRATPSVERAR